ncbi:MAG TPA: RcpC/CpaB family pilus assembly protein, partial [Symbiobacteriaceae bacterium]|nr:RcpC/CpaB family pilus assembly protein [Symbiobacteriaceae bacterium]
AGHPNPGDLVDLILFLQSSKDRPSATARILFEGIQVLGKGPVSPTQSGVPDGSQGPKLTSLTLAMQPDQAVELTLAEQVGYIRAVLRPAIQEGNHGRLMFREDSYK